MQSKPRENTIALHKQPGTLSVHRSLLIRFYPGVDMDTGEISGRIEHVVSGESKEFRSVTDLLRSIGQLLRSEDLRTEP